MPDIAIALSASRLRIGLVGTCPPRQCGIATFSKDLERAIAKLPIEQRQAVLLVGLEGMPYDEVASVLNVPIGTLYQWRHKGYGPPAWRLGRSLRYDAAAVRRWLVEEVA